LISIVASLNMVASAFVAFVGAVAAPLRPRRASV